MTQKTETTIQIQLDLKFVKVLIKRKVVKSKKERDSRPRPTKKSR